jgi:hypothetical protein
MSNPRQFNNDKRYLASKFLDVAGNSKENFLYLPAVDIASLDFVSDVPIFIYDTTNRQWVSYFQGVAATISGGGSSTHNLLAGLQGGAPSEYYHLSNAQYTKLSQGNFQSNWNASTNSPAIPAASAANKDQFYRVTTAGTTSIDGIANWKVGDWIWSTGTVWIRLANSSGDSLDILTIGVNGQTVFAISQLPINPLTSKLELNGAKQKYGIDYTIAGTVLTWISPIFTLKTSDTLELYYT